MEVMPMLLQSFGGIVTNEKAQVGNASLPEPLCGG